MGLPRLESCCFVLDLKTGNIVLGCINAFFSFVLLVVMIVISATIDDVETREQDENELNVEAQAAISGLYAMSIILVFMFLAKFFFDIFFVYGVIKERAVIIKAYFILWIVFFLLSMFTFFINVLSFSAGTIATELFYIALNVYAILLCHSFYQQLNEREEV